MKIRSAFILILLVSLTTVRGLAQGAGSAPAVAVNKALQSELSRMGEEDQKLRAMASGLVTEKSDPAKPALSPGELKALWQEQEETDRKNMRRLEEILQEYGWPGKSLAGEEGARSAFLILQHADLEYLKKYYPLLKEAAAKGEARPAHAAMMEDRILMYEGKKQIYGTQLSNNALYPIEDEEHVDARRVAVGLPPLVEYLKMFGLEYKPPVKK